MSARRSIKRVLRPLRTLARRFVRDPDIVDRETMVYKAAFVVTADNVEGDYLEFGVLAGNSFIKAYRAFQEAVKVLTFSSGENNVTSEDVLLRTATWQRRRFFAFDSFEGLPKVSGIDSSGVEFREGKYVSSLGVFKRNLDSAGLPEEKLVTVKGWFTETLNRKTLDSHRLRHAAIVYIDSDLYASAKSALDFIKPLIVDGTVIMFDEWYGYKGHPDLGERRAFREFAGEMEGWTFTEFQKEGARRCSFIANKSLTAANRPGE